MGVLWASSRCQQGIAGSLEEGDAAGNHSHVTQVSASFVIGTPRCLDRHNTKGFRFLIVEHEIDNGLGKTRANQQQCFGARPHEHVDHGQQLFRILDIEIAEQNGGVVHDDTVGFLAVAQHRS